MTSLLPASIRFFPLVLPLLLAGCDQESDVLPADGRDFDAETYIAGKPYSGRVMNGYLQNARVWLDLDGDGQPTPGPLTLASAAGVDLVLAGGEPTTMTAADGEFALDVSELEQDPRIAPDLDPRDYPLMALALPGQTLEQTESGPRGLEQAFMLSAPPGVRNVSPLTTLVRQRRVNGIGEFLVGTSDLALALGNINLVSDYVLSGDQRAQAYASAFARFLAAQLPQAYNDLLRAGDGTERFLSAEAVRLMGISFARNALAMVEAVDEAAGSGDYGAVDIASLTLPDVELELDDSVLVSGQTVYARAAGGLPSSMTSLDALAELAFNYAEDGRLRSVVANGCMAPSLTEMVRVINADGKMATIGTQWVPTVSLNQEGGSFYDEPGTDERLSFDWQNGSATFETRTSCHGDLADASELGGPPEITYAWTLSNGRVASLTATRAGQTEVLTPDYAYNSGFLIGFTRAINGTERETVDLVSEPDACSADIAEIDADKLQVVSAIQPFTLSGALPIPSGFTNLGLELDTREGMNRPLRYPFQDQGLLGTAGVTNDDGFEWKFYYPTEASGDLVADQPNLISAAYLGRYSGDRECGRNFGSTPASAYARVEYAYQRLSEYLAGQVR